MQGAKDAKVYFKDWDFRGGGRSILSENGDHRDGRLEPENVRLLLIFSLS